MDKKETATGIFYGDDAVKGIGHIVLRPQEIRKNYSDGKPELPPKLTKFVIGGVLIFSEEEFKSETGSDELWEVEIIIKPRVKRRSKDTTYWDYSISQILSDNWTNPKNWSKPYFKTKSIK